MNTIYLEKRPIDSVGYFHQAEITIEGRIFSCMGYSWKEVIDLLLDNVVTHFHGNSTTI